MLGLHYDVMCHCEANIILTPIFAGNKNYEVDCYSLVISLNIYKIRGLFHLSL